MKASAATTLTERLRRFARWFFTFSPEPVADPLQTLRPRTPGARPRRHDAPQLRAQNSGHVHVSDRKRP